MIERLNYLRDLFNGDLPITQSINSAQVVEILDAIIKTQPTVEVEPSCDVVELEKAIKELTDLANNGTIGEFHEDNLKMLLGAFKIQSGRKPADSKIRELQALSEPLIEWLNDNFNPHVHIVIEPTGAQLYEGVIGIINHKFLKD